MSIKIRDWVIEQYYRILISLSLLTIVNFILLVIAVSDKLKVFLPFDTLGIILIMVPTGILLVWLIGYVLDTKIKYMQQFYRTQTNRNPPILEILERIRRIEVELKRLKKS